MSMTGDGGAFPPTRWWWIRHAPVPDGGRIYGQGDLDCDCSDTLIFDVLARELPGDAVWVTSNLVRTKQTAAPVASRFQIEPVAVPVELDADSNPTPASTKALAQAIVSRGGTVLVVGHSNTIPFAIRELGGPSVEIDEKTFDDMFVVTLVDGKFSGFTHLKYGP